ncbi:MerC domain-containing protein [Candidatus Marinimicrobia bacterium]|nr:MerC domain-containing protein [Candidatus Neomarinimicrobiota bacterium]
MLNSINISIKNIKVDSLGAFVSGLCMLHCLATPIFFIASACSAACCNFAPTWWQSLDYIFLVISLFAVIQASRNSNSSLVPRVLLANWLGLGFFILNAKFGWISVHQNIKFIPAFLLIGFHLYNMKYCQCESNECC